MKKKVAKAGFNCMDCKYAKLYQHRPENPVICHCRKRNEKEVALQPMNCTCYEKSETNNETTKLYEMF